ncbi:MAG: 3-dehydroquinate synthase [Treponema sp.]
MAPNHFTFSTPRGETRIIYEPNCVRLPVIPVQNGRYNALYVCDTNTMPLLQYAVNFQQEIPAAILPAGETEKNFSSAAAVLRTCSEAELDRNALLIGFGGGVVCDITAFAASLYMRGIRCILVPTTLLAMADAAVGGKTAVNVPPYKNSAGTFYAAETVFICPQVLKTLPYPQYHAGLAEILKMAVLYDCGLYGTFQTSSEALLHGDTACIAPAIRSAVEAKAAVVAADFFEKGERSFLNFGHTFAHALESISNFSVLHGEAVAWGMARALAAGVQAGVTDPLYAQELSTLIRQYGWCTEAVYPIPNIPATSFADAILHAMKSDKKNTQGEIRLVLQKQWTVNGLYAVHEHTIREVLQ